MSDLIRRGDVEEALQGLHVGDVRFFEKLRKALDEIPSAEPEQIIKIGQRSGKTLESAIDYLHSVGWLQEHDRILTESAEPERKKGSFIGTEYDGYADGEPVYYEWKCSECGCVFEDDEPTYNFCPRCGADMRGE